MKYQIHPKYREQKVLIALNKEGKAVNLIGTSVEKVVKNKGPEYKTTVPGATQEDLKFVHESKARDRFGDLIVIAVEEKLPASKK